MSYINLIAKIALNTRINEHKKDKNSKSVAWAHQTNFKHDFDWNNTTLFLIENVFTKNASY